MPRSGVLEIPLMPMDRTMMLNPEGWPRYPLLPLKRSDPAESHRLEYGTLYRGTGFIVYLVGIYAIPAGRRLPDVLEPYKAMVYSNVDAVLDDGWRVD